MQVAFPKKDQQTVTSEVILLAVDPKVGSVDLPAFCAIADHALTKSLAASSSQQQPPNLSHLQQQQQQRRAGNSHIPSQKYHAGGAGAAAKAKDLVRVAQQTDILLFVMLKQLSAVSLYSAETSYLGTDITETLNSTRPITTLSFLSKWAQRAAADGTVAMVLGELQRSIGGGEGGGARSPRGGTVGGYGFQSQGLRHITIAAPCLSPSMLPHLLARQQAVIEEHEGFASPQLGLPPVVACIELSHSKEWAEQPHLPLDASQQTRSPNLLLGPLPAAVALPTGKKGAGSGSGGGVGGASAGTAGGANSGAGGGSAASAGGIGAGGTQAVACGNAIDTDGTAKLSLPHDPSLLEHMRIQLIRPYCSSSGASAVSLLANQPGGALLQGVGMANGLPSGATKSTAAAAAAGGPSNLKKGGGAGASAAKTSSPLGGAGGASAAVAGGAGGLSGLVRVPPLPSSFSCNTIASDHPIPRPIGLAIALKLREFLTTIHELCVRYFSNSITNPILLDGVAMGSVSGLSYFDNCVSALRRAERMRHLAAALSAVAAVNTAAGGNSSAPAASAVPTSKSGSRSAAAAAAAASAITPESDFLALRPEDRAAMVEKDVVEALITEASKAVMLDNGLSPLQAIAASSSASSSGGGASAGGTSQTGSSSAQASGRGQGGAGASRGQSGAVGGTSSSSSAAAAAASSTQNAKNIAMSTTSAAALYVALSAFVRSPHTTMVDVRVASLLVAVSAQLVVLRGVINAYGAPIPVASSVPSSAAVPVPAQTSGKQQSSSAAASSAASSLNKPQLAYVRITPADFSTTVEAHHVRAFFTTPPPVQLAPPPVVAEKGSGGAKGLTAASSSTANTPLLVQQVPHAAMAALPSALLDIAGNLCGVEEAMRGELLSSDGIVDLSTMARTEHFMPSTADKILQHLSADLANVKSSLFKPKCPAVEVPLLWVPPAPPPSVSSSSSPTQETTAAPVATPASGTRPPTKHNNKEPTSSPSTAALLSATNAAATTAELVSPTVSAGGIVLPPIGSSVFQLGTALHHDGCSVFKLHINPFPSAVVTSAVVCEGIRLAATEIEKVRSHARFSPSAASTRSAMGSGAFDTMRCYTTLFETPVGAGVGGGASSSMGMREVARLVAAPVESVDGLLTAVTNGLSARSYHHTSISGAAKGQRSGYGAGEDIEVLEVVDVEKHNLRLLNRALAETRVRLAAVEKGKRLVERQRVGLGANLHAGDNAVSGGADGGGADPHNAPQQTAPGAKSTSPQRGAGGGNSGTSRGNVTPGAKKGRTTSLAPQQANAGAESGGVAQTNDPATGPGSGTTIANNNSGGFSIESIADEKRGNDVLRRSDPIPRKLVPTAGGGVQSSFLYVQPRPDVVAQNKAEEEAVRAILAPTSLVSGREAKTSGKELAKRFVSSFFNKTFGGGVPSADEQRSGTVPTVNNSNPSGLVDDLVSTRARGDNEVVSESDDALASQRLRAEKVMLLREVSKAAEIIGSTKQQKGSGVNGAVNTNSMLVVDGDFSFRRGESYLAQLCRSAIAEREGGRGALLGHTALYPTKQRVEEPLLFTGGDETGGLALLSHAASSMSKNTNNFPPTLGAAQRRLSVERSDAVRGVNSILDGRAPPIGNSAHVTSWINKTLSPNEQQFLLGQAVLLELAKANFPCLTPRFTTSCHYFTEDATTTTTIRSTSVSGVGRSGSIFPAAVAERASPLFALFPNNVRVAVIGKTLTDALSSSNAMGGVGDTFGRMRGGEQTSATCWSPPVTCGYLAIGVTHLSNASATTVQQPDSDSYGEVPLALESNERKRISRWSFSAVVGDRAQFSVDPSSLNAALSHFAGKASPQEKLTTIGGGAGKGGALLTKGSAVVGVSPLRGPTPLPMLRDADDESDLLIAGGRGDRADKHSTGDGRGMQKQPAQLLPPTTTAPPFFSSSSALTSGAAVSTHGALVGVGGRRVVRGERTMVLPYDGSIVEVTATLGGARGGSSGNTGVIKYHRNDVTVAGHYTIGKNGHVTSPHHRIVVSFPDEALLSSSSSGTSAGSENGVGSAAGSLPVGGLSAPRTPLVTVEGNLMTITDRQSDERFACVTRVKGIVHGGGEGSSSPYGSNPTITFASLSTSLHTAAIGGPLLSDVSGSLVAASVALNTVNSGVSKKRKHKTTQGSIKTSLIDLPPRALVSLAAIIATKRAPLASIAHQLQAVSAAAAADLQSAANSAISASIVANASVALTSSSTSKKGGGGGGAKSSSQAAGGGGGSSVRSNSPAATSLSTTGSQQQQQQIMLASLSLSLPANASSSNANKGAIAPASIPETVVERALLSAASSAATCVAEAACTAIAQRAGATILNKLRSSSGVGTAGGAVPPLPHYQTRSLALNSGIVASTNCSDDVDLNRSHNRPAPIPIVGYSTWFARGDLSDDAAHDNSSDVEGDDVEEGCTEQKRSSSTLRRVKPTSSSSLRTGLRVQSDIEQSRDVCSVSGVVTVRYVSGSITKLFPDGSVATLLVCPSDKAVGYYTGLTARTSSEGKDSDFVLSPSPLHPTLQPEGWSLAHPHTASSSRKDQGVTSSRLGVSVNAALTASSLALGSGGSADASSPTGGPRGAAGVGARPPSPTTRGTANKVHPTANASNASGASGARKQGGAAADLSSASVFARPPSATFLKAAAASASIPPSGLGGAATAGDFSVVSDTSVLGPIPIAIPKYWLLTSPTGKRCARRCGGSVLDASSSAFPKTEEWCSMRVNCESLLPAIVTEDGAFLSPSSSGASSLSSFVKPLKPLPAAVAYDAQNLCHVVSRADGTIIASYNQHAERPTFIPTSPQRTTATGTTKASPAPHKQSSPPTQLRDIDGSGKACIRVSIHADGTTIVGVLAPSSSSSSSKPMLPNFVPMPTHLSALDGLIHFLAGHAIEKCGGDVTAVWPESLGLSFRSSNDGGGAPAGLSTSLAFLVEHPRFPRVILRRNSPLITTSVVSSPHDTFVLYSDQTLLASELVTVRVPATQHTKPGGGAGGHFESGVGTSGGGHAKHPHPPQFFHTRLIRPNGTTVRVMNTSPFTAQTPQSEAAIGTAPVLIVEPSHVAMSLQSPYRQLLCPTATFAFQATTSILGNVPTSLSGKARHMATVATSAALHEACPVFSLSISDRSSDSTSVDGTPLMRLVDSRNYVTSVWSRALVVGFDRNTTERLLVNMAPQGLATHAMSKRRQAEEAMKRSSGKAAFSSSPTVLSGADSYNFMSPLELSLRAVARSFITKYALIGTPQVGIFHRAREDTLRPQINRNNNNNVSDPDGASTTAPSVFSRASENASVFGGVANGGGGGGGMDATLGGLIPSRFAPGRENPALLSEKETSESLYSLGLDYNPHLYVVKEAKGEHKEAKQLNFTQLLSVRDLAPYIRYNIARSNTSGPIATDLTTTNNEEDDLAERCLAIFPASASGPVFSSVITASKSIASGEPHVEQLHFYESYRVPNLLPAAAASGVEGANTASNNPHQYIDPMMTSLSSMLRARAGGLVGGGSMASSPSSLAITAPPLHRPHQGICAWLPKTALPPKRLLMPHHQQTSGSASSSSSGMAVGQQVGGSTINWLGQGHSQHVTSNARQLLRFQRYNVPIRDAVAAVHLSVEEQRRSMVIYTRGVVAQTEREEQRNRDCGVGDLQDKYKAQLEAIKRGVDPSKLTLASSLGTGRGGEGQNMHVGGDVMVLTLEGSPPDSPRMDAAGSDHSATDNAAEYDGVAAGGAATGASVDTNQQRRDLIKSTNTARERAVVYLNQRMVKPLCSSIIVCDPYPTMAFGLLPVPVFDDRPLRPDGTAPPPEPLYPFKYQMKGTIRNITNDTVLLVIRNPTKKVDDRTGERRLVSAISVVEGNNMRLGPNGSATFCIELETTTNEMVRRSLGDAVGQISKQEEARLTAVAMAEVEGTSPPGARRFVMDLVERLRIDVVGACEPLVLNVTASFVLNTSLKGSTIPKPGVFIKT